MTFTAALNAVENKILNVSDLVKKADYDAKTSDIWVECFTTSNDNKCAGEILDKKLKGKRLVDKLDISEFIDNFK